MFSLTGTVFIPSGGPATTNIGDCTLPFPYGPAGPAMAVPRKIKFVSANFILVLFCVFWCFVVFMFVFLCVCGVKQKEKEERVRGGVEKKEKKERERERESEREEGVGKRVQPRKREARDTPRIQLLHTKGTNY